MIAAAFVLAARAYFYELDAQDAARIGEYKTFFLWGGGGGAGGKGRVRAFLPLLSSEAGVHTGSLRGRRLPVHRCWNREEARAGTLVDSGVIPVASSGDPGRSRFPDTCRMSEAQSWSGDQGADPFRDATSAVGSHDHSRQLACAACWRLAHAEGLMLKGGSGDVNLCLSCSELPPFRPGALGAAAVVCAAAPAAAAGHAAGCPAGGTVAHEGRMLHTSPRGPHNANAEALQQLECEEQSEKPGAPSRLKGKRVRAQEHRMPKKARNMQSKGVSRHRVGLPTEIALVFFQSFGC